MTLMKRVIVAYLVLAVLAVPLTLLADDNFYVLMLGGVVAMFIAASFAPEYFGLKDSRRRH